MPITMSPQVLTASQDAYITQGVTARVRTLAGASASGTLSISIIDFPVTVLSAQTGSSTVSFTNVPDNTANTWWVQIAGRGSNTVTFTGVTWDGGSAPSFASGTAKSVVEFYSRDGGATIYGRLRFANVAQFVLVKKPPCQSGGFFIYQGRMRV